jgi:CHAT domain-containing protein
VVYAASAGVLARVMAAERSGTGALVLGYTPSEDPIERHIFLSEAHEVAERFNTTALVDDEATADALRRGAGAGLVHLSCHGYFNHDDPLASGVMLKDGVLAARDWMGLRLDAELLTLSACETGFSRVGRGDEIASLSRALLGAGAAAALLTLWTVNAQSTKEWMLEFYDACWDSRGRRRMSKAAAFQQATLALRARYPDPIFWAPFVLTGSGE